ncbi:sulfite exporter TauE/SafE family protein [Streptomyces abikoensis]|uniref:sulfite exporter TauE/SafE family protein n=1 Tax=Streptomyces abikoensis TaxID=97398 RepID=UPI003675E2B6
MSALILALAAGAAVGLALGALGGGGSVLAVPALIYLLGFTPAAATTASLLIVAATSATALYAHARAGNVRWRTGALFAASGLLPAAAAGAVAAHLPQRALTAAFAAIATLAAVMMLLGTRERRSDDTRSDDRRSDDTRSDDTRSDDTRAEDTRADDTRPDAPEPPRRAPARAAGTGAGLGALTGLLGVGGGFLVVPTLVAVLAFEMQAAVGTSLLVITTNSLASLLTRGATASGLDWSVIAPFAATAILGAWDGKRLAAKVSGTALRRAFAVALLAVAAFMLVDALT